MVCILHLAQTIDTYFRSKKKMLTLQINRIKKMHWFVFSTTRIRFIKQVPRPIHVRIREYSSCFALHSASSLRCSLISRNCSFSLETSSCRTSHKAFSGNILQDLRSINSKFELKIRQFHGWITWTTNRSKT